MELKLVLTINVGFMREASVLIIKISAMRMLLAALRQA